MEDETLKRIADSLERIATLLENKQVREINIHKKSQIAEKKENAKKQVRTRPIPERKQTIRVKTVAPNSSK
jgi:hypothetical protein